MGIKRVVSVGLCLLIICVGSGTSSCKTRSAGCEAHGVTRTKQMKKNRNHYNSRYSVKVKPVKKTYVIRNKRR